jgi:hypothetical protein
VIPLHRGPEAPCKNFLSSANVLRARDLHNPFRAAHFVNLASTLRLRVVRSINIAGLTVALLACEPRQSAPPPITPPPASPTASASASQVARAPRADSSKPPLVSDVPGNHAYTAQAVVRSGERVTVGVEAAAPGVLDYTVRRKVLRDGQWLSSWEDRFRGAEHGARGIVSWIADTDDEQLVVVEASIRSRITVSVTPSVR